MIYDKLSIKEGKFIRSENIIEKDAYNKIIKKLSPQEKEIVNLHILCDMKFKDIAKLLNIPIRNRAMEILYCIT